MRGEAAREEKEGRIVKIVLEGKIAKREAGSAGEAEEMIDESYIEHPLSSYPYLNRKTKQNQI